MALINRVLGNRNRAVLLFLLVMGIAAYAAGLFVHVTRDASKYAALAREIYDSGEYINLTIHGEPYLQKPPMLFWLSALSFHIFGISDFAFKLPVLLFSFAGLFFTFRLGATLYNRETGLLAAFLLGTSQISFLYNMDIHTDSLLQSFVTFSLWQLSLFLKNGKRLPLFLGFTGIGLAMLTKGPVGAALPATAVIGSLLFTKRFRKLTDPLWLAGIILALVIITPALTGLYNQFGKEGLRFFFWDNNVGRIQGTIVSKNRNYLFYLINLLFIYAPWSLLLFGALFKQWKEIIRKRTNEPGWFLFWGIWPYFLLISVSHGKLPNYIYMLMPLFSILIAQMVSPLLLTDERKGSFRQLLIVQNGMALLCASVLLIITLWLFPLQPFLKTLFLIPFFLAAIHPLIRGGSRGYRLLIPSAAMIIAVNFFININAAPLIFNDQASVKAALLFNKEGREDEIVYNYNYPSHELFFYSKRPVRQLINDVTMWELLRNGKTWVFTTGEVINRLPDEEWPPMEIIPLEHVWINKLKLKYLNPATRASGRDTLYLIKPLTELTSLPRNLHQSLHHHDLTFRCLIADPPGHRQIRHGDHL